MGGLFGFSPFADFVTRIPDHSVKNAAARILPLGITIIGKLQHGFDKFHCSFNIFVGRFQYLKSIISVNAGICFCADRVYSPFDFLFN